MSFSIFLQIYQIELEIAFSIARLAFSVRRIKATAYFSYRLPLPE